MTNLKRTLTITAACIAAFAVAAPTAGATVNMWATFGANAGGGIANVTRTSNDQNAPAGSTIDINNLGLSVSNSGGAKPTFSNITFTKKVDLNTPALMAATASGQAYASAKITVDGTGAGGARIASSKVYCIEKAFVSSVSNRIDDETGDGGYETVSLKALGEIHVGVKTARAVNPFNILSYNLVTNLSGSPNNGCQIP